MKAGQVISLFLIHLLNTRFISLLANRTEKRNGSLISYVDATFNKTFSLEWTDK